MSAPLERASMKALVPDLAMVPKLFTRSALVIPILQGEERVRRLLLSSEGVEINSKHTQSPEWSRFCFPLHKGNEGDCKWIRGKA
jgi:hypothetical protein